MRGEPLERGPPRRRLLAKPPPRQQHDELITHRTALHRESVGGIDVAGAHQDQRLHRRLGAEPVGEHGVRAGDHVVHRGAQPRGSAGVDHQARVRRLHRILRAEVGISVGAAAGGCQHPLAGERDVLQRELRRRRLAADQRISREEPGVQRDTAVGERQHRRVLIVHEPGVSPDVHAQVPECGVGDEQLFAVALHQPHTGGRRGPRFGAVLRRDGTEREPVDRPAEPVVHLPAVMRDPGDGDLGVHDRIRGSFGRTGGGVAGCEAAASGEREERCGGGMVSVHGGRSIRRRPDAPREG